MKKIAKSFISILTTTFLLCTLLTQSTRAQITIEDFEVVDSVTFSGSSITPWTQTSQVQNSGTYSITTEVDSLGIKYMSTDPINTTGLTSVLLKFKQICRIDFFDAAKIEVSNDGGLTFSQLTAYEFLQSNIDFPPFAGQSNTFTTATTMDWDPGVPTTIATNSMWHSAEFNLAPYLPAPTLIIRFALEDRNGNGNNGYPGWYIDDIELQQSHFDLLPAWSYSDDTCTVPNIHSFHVDGYAIGYGPTDSVSTHFYFGDGTDSIINLPISAGMFSTLINHPYINPGNYTVNITATSPNGITESETNSFNIITNSNCGSITGNIYTDNNSNCILDTGEPGVPYAVVYLFDNFICIQTQVSDFNGQYTFYNVPNVGNYSVVVDSSYLDSLPGSYHLICPLSGSLSVSSVPSGNYNFAITCNSGFNLTSYLQNWRHYGYYNLYVLTENRSCNMQNAVTKVVLDPATTFLNATTNPSSINGDTLIWNNILDANDYFAAYIQLLIDSTINSTDTVCYTIISEPTIGDIDPTDNIYSTCSPLGLPGFPFDPNNKLVMPEGNIASGTKLNYRVNFQNTGTATAQNVYVLDTLDADVEVSSIKFIGASHPTHIYILPGNVLKVDFPNIMLPDSNANEALSHGSFSYSINTKPSLQNGTTIENSAHIYFDYNAPVTTNTTVNTIQTTVGISELSKLQTTTIYPNPFSNEFSISSSENIKAVYLRTITGEQLLERKINDKAAKINVQNLPAGIYPLSIETDKGIKIYKLVKL